LVELNVVILHNCPVKTIINWIHWQTLFSHHSSNFAVVSLFYFFFFAYFLYVQLLLWSFFTTTIFVCMGWFKFLNIAFFYKFFNIVDLYLFLLFIFTNKNTLIKDEQTKKKAGVHDAKLSDDMTTFFITYS